MNYTEHDLNLITFGNADVYALGLASDADEDGGGSSQHSVNPNLSDY